VFLFGEGGRLLVYENQKNFPKKYNFQKGKSDNRFRKKQTEIYIDRLDISDICLENRELDELKIEQSRLTDLQLLSSKIED